MGAWRVEATYQGYPCTHVEWEQHDGLTPGRGKVHIDIAHCKKISVEARAIPWRGVNGYDWPGQIDISTWSKGLVGSTVAGYAPVFPPADGGFAQFGELILKTYDDNALVSTVTFRDIHVDTSAIEEVTEDLARCEDHAEGVITVPLVDIAYLYPTHGAGFFRINARHPSGELDPSSLKLDDSSVASTAASGATGVAPDPTGRRWKALEVFRFLFSQLPGSPAIVGSPDDTQSSPKRTCDLVKQADSLPDPEDVIGEGEPVVEILERLLDRYGYIAKRQPDGNYVVSKRGFTISDANTISTGGGKYGKGTYKNDEKRSVTRTGRPAAIVVQGKRRVLRGSAAYVHVLPDLDGSWLQHVAWLDKYGVSGTYYDGQACVGHEKQFADIVRKNPTKKSERLRDILRQNCYRTYAPAFLFAGKGAGYALKTADFEKSPFLPYVDAAYYLKELDALHVKVPRDSSPKQGDQGSFVVRGPLVWAQRWAQNIFRDIDQLKAYWTAQNQTFADDVAFYQSAIAQKQALLADVGFQLSAISKQMEGAVLDVNKAAGQSLVKIDHDIQNALKELGFEPGAWTIYEQRMTTTEAWQALYTARRLTADIARLKAQLKTHEDTFARKKADADKFFKAHEFYGGVQVWTNVPPAILPDGGFTIDPRTGILESADILAHCSRPFAMDRESGGFVDEDGMVYVHFGYESKTGNASDWSMVILSAEDGGDPDKVGEPKIVGGARGSPIKAKRERMNGRFYHTFEGGTVNLGAVTSEAFAKCSQQLAIPRRVTAYAVEWAGLRDYVLDGGISSVQYWSDGDIGKTVVGINTQFSRLNPITRAARGVRAGDHDLREELGRYDE